MLTDVTPTGHRHAVRRVSALTVGLAVAATASGCGAEAADGADEPRSPTVDAIDACLRAAVREFDFPVESPSATTISVDRGDDGWWAIRATAGEGTETATLTCTAVPDEDGARAASWNVSR